MQSLGALFFHFHCPNEFRLFTNVRQDLPHHLTVEYGEETINFPLSNGKPLPRDVIQTVR